MLKKYYDLKKIFLVGLMIISTSLIISCTNSNNNPSLIVFKNVNIIPMNIETVLENYNIVIENGKIVKIGKSRETKIPKNATVIDGKGKYLVPGLNDMHVHLWQEYELVLYLANGVTTIRDMFGNINKLSLREKIEQKEILGPRLYVSTPIIDGDSPIWSESTVIINPDDAEIYVTKYKEMGYDFIKIYEKLTTDVYDAIIKAAEKEDIPVVGHEPSLVGIEKAIQSGQKSIEHLDKYKYSNKLFDMTVENNVWNCPTLVVHENPKRALAGEELEGIEYVNPVTVRTWKSRIRTNPVRTDGLKYIANTIHIKGGKILLGTDANNPFIVPGFSIHDELANLVDAGLTPYEAIKTGTYYAAEFLNIIDETGTVEIGKNADLILINGNPLEDITNLKKIEGVMVRGKWINKSEIDNMLKSEANDFAY